MNRDFCYKGKCDILRMRFGGGRNMCDSDKAKVVIQYSKDTKG